MKEPDAIKFMEFLTDCASEFKVRYEKEGEVTKTIVLEYDGWEYRYDWVNKNFLYKTCPAFDCECKEPKKYTIVLADVDKTAESPVKVRCACKNKHFILHPFEGIGVVQRRDVGKMCFNVKGVWQTENDQQMTQRLRFKGVIN